jgi:hypothetical protein
METVDIVDKMTGGAMLKNRRNAIAKMKEEKWEAQHNQRAANAKRGRAMLALKKKKPINMLADNSDY